MHFLMHPNFEYIFPLGRLTHILSANFSVVVVHCCIYFIFDSIIYLHNSFLSKTFLLFNCLSFGLSKSCTEVYITTGEKLIKVCFKFD